MSSVLEPRLPCPWVLMYLIRMIGLQTMRTNLSVKVAEGHVCRFCLQLLHIHFGSCFRQYLIPLLAKKYSRRILRFRVLIRQPSLLLPLHLLVILRDPELLNLRSTFFLLRNVSPVSLDLCPISVCVSTSQQVSLSDAFLQGLHLLFSLLHEQR